MAEYKVNALVNIDFHCNEAIKTEYRLKKLNNEIEITKEDFMGQMIEERRELEKALIKKGMTFKEVIQFLNKKAHANTKD